jgi:hypothetical protein
MLMLKHRSFVCEHGERMCRALRPPSKVLKPGHVIPLSALIQSEDVKVRLRGGIWQ